MIGVGRSATCAPVLATLGLLAAASSAQATPEYAITAASRCDTCHIEPIGWRDPEFSKRRCTLDCTSCHYNRTGGGLRTPAGRYYAQTALPLLGAGPGAQVDPNIYRSGETHSTRGMYSLLEGFSGWDRGGTTNVADIPDRYGTLEATPSWAVGGDLRMMAYSASASADDVAVFPMQADVSAMVEPLEAFRLLTTAGLQGRRKRTLDNLDEPEHRARDYFTVREFVAEYSDMPFNGYVRAGRFTRPFGWRLPDHTAFTRREVGLDNYAQVFGFEAGVNPNYPFATVAAYTQGWQAWPGERAQPGAGISMMAGVRELGWQVFGSIEYQRLTEAKSDTVAGALSWGINLDPLSYLGEVRKRIEIDPLSYLGEVVMRGFGRENGASSVMLSALHEVRVRAAGGVLLLVGIEWLDLDIRYDNNATTRVKSGLQLDLVRSLQWGAEIRNSWGPDGQARMESFTTVHAYF